MKAIIESALQWKSGIKSFYCDVDGDKQLITWHPHDLQEQTSEGKRIEGTANNIAGSKNGLSIVKGDLAGLEKHDLLLIKEHAMDGGDALAIIDDIKEFETADRYDRNTLAIADDGDGFDSAKDDYKKLRNSSLNGENAAGEFGLALSLYTSEKVRFW